MNKHSTTGGYFNFLLPIWPIFMIAVWGLWNTFRSTRDAKMMERSLSWPEAQGSVLSSEAGWGHITVAYEFVVPTGSYRGVQRMSLKASVPDKYGRNAGANGDRVQDVLALFPVGSGVIIRYNPQQPNQSVLFCAGKISQRSSASNPAEPPRFYTARA